MNMQRRTAALIATAGLLIALAGCQSVAGGALHGPPQRPAVVVPVGIDPNRPADRIAEELARTVPAHVAPVVADRLEHDLELEARARGFVEGCIRYVLVETLTDWRVVCVQMR